MTSTTQPAARFLRLGAIAVLAAGLATAIEAGPRHAVPRSSGGGGGPRASGPSHRGGAPSATRGAPAPRGAVPPRGQPAPRGRANGVARYGYGYGYGYGGAWGIGYPCWGYGYGSGWWGVGWYGDWWGWPGYGYGYGVYAPWYGAWYYGPGEASYVAAEPPPAPSGPAVVETGVSPSKAVVVLDGETVGFASDYNGRWDKLTVAPGPHTIAFQLKGYRTLVITFEAHPGASYAFSDALVAGEGEDHRAISAPAPAATAIAAAPVHADVAPQSTSPITIGRLRVRVEPGDAAVYLDGEYLGLGAELGRIHGALAVATGAHRLEAARPGFVSGSRAIDVGTVDVVTVDLALAPQP